MYFVAPHKAIGWSFTAAFIAFTAYLTWDVRWTEWSSVVGLMIAVGILAGLLLIPARMAFARKWADLASVISAVPCIVLFYFSSRAASDAGDWLMEVEASWSPFVMLIVFIAGRRKGSGRFL